jgi:glycosyltransferase involved in cell wall biosynthesis
MKILFLPAWYPTEKNITYGIFIKEHAKAAVLYDDIIVIYNEEAEKGIKGIYKTISDKIEDGIRTIRIRHKKLFIPKISYFLYLLSIILSFKKLLEEGWRPDIIHVHVYSSGIPAVILSNVYGIPLIITEHTTDFSTHSVSILEKIKANFFFNKAEIILPVSEVLKNALINYYGIKNRFCVIPNAVNIGKFYPTPAVGGNEKNMDMGKKKLLFVGNLIPRKGIPCLLKALAELKQKRSDFILDIIGDGPDRDEYEKMVLELGLYDEVKFHGRMSDIISFMRNCDFFVLPSLYENFGVVYIEAMACGKPVIGTNAGGQIEFISEQSGVLVSPGDVNALKEAINYMLDNYKNYSPENISLYVKNNFSYEVIGKRLNDIYMSVVEK